ncbi:hypothetical protein FRAHR75_570003 [Frankia sp. Hr75.2]|nr:hypothetical protein FRAHR75_570003 [Frankia sp. Hr75.2]SQD97577.1 hypothetical protein FMEAI12_4220002 [Parafrankia sp. Ea1.12]
MMWSVVSMTINQGIGRSNRPAHDY